MLDLLAILEHEEDGGCYPWTLQGEQGGYGLHVHDWWTFPCDCAVAVLEAEEGLERSWYLSTGRNVGTVAGKLGSGRTMIELVSCVLLRWITNVRFVLYPLYAVEEMICSLSITVI